MLFQLHFISFSGKMKLHGPLLWDENTGSNLSPLLWNSPTGPDLSMSTCRRMLITKLHSEHLVLQWNRGKRIWAVSLFWYMLYPIKGDTLLTVLYLQSATSVRFLSAEVTVCRLFEECRQTEHTTFLRHHHRHFNALF